MTPPEQFNIMEILRSFKFEFVYVTIAAMGGLARYLQKYLTDGEFRWKRLLAEMMVSSFSGYMFWQFALFVGMTAPIVPLLVGMGGYMGAEALKFIENLLTKKLKK